MAKLTLALFLSVFLVFGAGKKRSDYVRLTLDKKNPTDPGKCDHSNHGEIKLVQDRLGADKVLICTNENSTILWKTIDGSSTVGEYFNPAFDCSDIVDRVPGATDGFYWINSKVLENVSKVWCDVTIDSGGFMLVAKKNDPVSWTVPSSKQTVDPRGKPHWSSNFGKMEMLDIRFQISTTSKFTDTQAHWSFRLANKRPFGQLLVRNSGGCTKNNPGIGDIAFVKDLQTGKIVNKNFKCSVFSGHLSPLIGWGNMNKCLQKSCSAGFAYFPGLNIRLDDSGSFSYSAHRNSKSSGILHRSTAFVGCSHRKCCACYGPKGGTKEYCLTDCTSINGGVVKKNVHIWIWIRSSIPKRAWRKCIEYTVKDNNGKNEVYNVDYDTGTPRKGNCANSYEIKKNGAVLVASNEKGEKKIPPAPGLLLYRPHKEKLFVQGGKDWKEIAMEKEVKYLNDSLERAFLLLADRIRNLNSTVFEIKDNRVTSCKSLKSTSKSGLVDGYYQIGKFRAYCDMKNDGWTLVARFSNSDSKKWIEDGNLWYDRISAYGNAVDPKQNKDMVSEAFWKVKANEFKITRSDDSSHTALLQTISNCLRGGTFRSKITSYGNFRNGAVWASNQCRGSCRVRYGGQYRSTKGFEKYSCSSGIQSSNYIGFWCDWSTGDGAVMMIGGGGSGCARADHGIGITEENSARFGGGQPHYDFGYNADSSQTSSYSLNLWVR